MSHEPRQTRPGVILTPDQRIRVFISSTLEELAGERVAARRADIAAEFSDGVFFISLADIRSDRDIVQAIAESPGARAGLR